MDCGIRHLAVIMDGNGRWAKARRKPRLAGHKAGADTLDRVMHWCREAGIRHLTVYAFSTENWKRSKAEVAGLMKLLGTYLRTKEKQLVEDGVRFRALGRTADLPPALQKKIARVEEATKGGEWNLNVALSYGGRAEIVDAARKLADSFAADPAARAAFDADPEAAFARHLYAPDVPDPDLLVRTSGELRVSNFLLWEIAYSEIYVTPVLWPDFDKAEFDKALAAYASRERRMGGRLKPQRTT